MNIADGIQSLFGDNCEVLLHDLSNLESSTYYVVGNVTNRKVGAPLTNLGLKLLKEKNSSNVLVYRNVTKDGKILKSVTVVVKDNNKPIGFLCINFDITNLVSSKNLLSQLIEINETQNSMGNEVFLNNVNEILTFLVDSVIKNATEPISMMSKEDKLRIIKELSDKGVFLIKGAIEYVSKLLGVTKYTVYSYIGEVQDE